MGLVVLVCIFLALAAKTTSTLYIAASRCVFYSCTAINFCLVLVFVYTVIQMHKANPGFIPANPIEITLPRKEFVLLFADGTVVAYPVSYCKICNCYQPLRAKHCPFSNRCVLRYDFYSVLVNQSVGLGNTSAYLLLLFQMAFLSTYELIIALVSTMLLYRDSSMDTWVPSLVSIVLCTFCSLFFICLYLHQHFLLYHNLTRWDSTPYLRMYSWEHFGRYKSFLHNIRALHRAACAYRTLTRDVSRTGVSSLAELDIYKSASYSAVLTSQNSARLGELLVYLCLGFIAPGADALWVSPSESSLKFAVFHDGNEYSAPSELSFTKYENLLKLHGSEVSKHRRTRCFRGHTRLPDQ